jgi:tRNA C32,U32 (ribose-2'-O)-methylase TrmJ
LILGNEVIGVDTAVLDLCDRIVEIPTFGQKNSLNVASAAPIVVYEVLRQWGCMDAQQLQQGQGQGQGQEHQEEGESKN